ncbi:DUF779 domain-containing protein [uncultured Arcticibacterium sp.]|uniref:DUF779 domain-containing protein n=1 Tax=uncultured Arcticibacterium sp. TaxID=2173042 RepID=UPI0030FCFE9F
MNSKRVVATEKAIELIKKLRKQYGDLIFHQSGGCCDGSAPMCYPSGDFYINETDIQLGEVADCPFYMARDQYEYWKHTHLTLDVTEGRGSSFSLEIPLGVRFIIKSRLLTKEESDSLTLQD